MNIKVTLASIILVIAGLACAWFLLGEGCAGPSRKQQGKEVSAISRHIDSLNGATQRFYDSVNFYLDKEKAHMAALKKEKEVLQTELNLSKRKVSALVAGNRSVVIRRDTVTFYDNCDSLAVEAGLLMATVEYLQTINDTLTVSFENQLSAKDSLIMVQAAHINLLRASSDEVADKYMILNKDYRKANRQVKVQRTFTRILGGAVIVLSGIILAK